MAITELRQRLLRLAALARMRNDDSLPDLLNFDEHWEAVARQADSKLVFLPIWEEAAGGSSPAPVTSQYRRRR